MLSVSFYEVMLSDVILSAVMLSVAPIFIMQIVVAQFEGIRRPNWGFNPILLCCRKIFSDHRIQLAPSEKF
jgi:hypothetical protein